MKVEIIRICQLVPGDWFMQFGVWREVIKIKEGVMTTRRAGQKQKETSTGLSKEFVQVEKSELKTQ